MRDYLEAWNSLKEDYTFYFDVHDYDLNDVPVEVTEAEVIEAVNSYFNNDPVKLFNRLVSVPSIEKNIKKSFEEDGDRIKEDFGIETYEDLEIGDSELKKDFIENYIFIDDPMWFIDEMFANDSKFKSDIKYYFEDKAREVAAEIDKEIKADDATERELMNWGRM